MTETRRALLVLSLLIIGLAACSDDESTTPQPDVDSGIDADAAADPDTGDVPADVVADAADVTVDAADVLADVSDAGQEGFVIDDLGPITDLRIDGLGAPVEIKFDDDGIPSILCQSDEDCVAALGYLHARDRFWQMDLRRRAVRGRLSQIVPSVPDVFDAADIDFAARSLFSTPAGEPIEEVLLANSSDDTVALLEAYASGVNAWIDDVTNGTNGASLQLEYGFNIIVLGDEIPPWTPEDSLASVAALVNNLTNAASSDIRNGEVFAAIEASDDYDASVFVDYFRPWPFGDSIIIDDYTYPAEKSSPTVVGEWLRLAEHASALREARAPLERVDAILGVVEDRGSNNWVVGPDRSLSGNALFTNDPHLGLDNPSIWYVAHMDATTNGDGDYHVAGLTFAGLPFVIIGQNEHIAWGATNTSFDFSDVYVEQLTDDGDGVVFNDTDVPFVEVDFDFPQPFGDVVTRTARFVPHHGPVLSVDAEAGTAISLRWTGNLMTTDGNFLTELMRATTVEEGRAALRNITSIGQNWVMVDTAGNFGWFPYNTVPNRPWASAAQPAYLPLDGTGDQEWDGFIAYDDLPQALNPEKDYLATANNDMTGANLDGDPTNDGHPLLQSSVADGFRHERIVDLLEASAEHTPQTLLEVVGDTYSIFGELVSPELLAVNRAGLSTNAQALYDAIENWDLGCPSGLATSDPTGVAASAGKELSEARGCAAFHRVFSDAYRGWQADERAAQEWAGRPTRDSFLRALLRPGNLANPDLLWDDVTTDGTTETKLVVLTSAFETAAAFFEDQIGDDPSDWLWGRVHTMTLSAPLFTNFVPTFDEGPFARDGGLETVSPANFSLGSDSLTFGSGASMRLICEAPAAGVSCAVQLPGGMPHFRNDENYIGMIERWFVNQPTDLVFSHADLDAPTITATAPDAE